MDAYVIPVRYVLFHRSLLRSYESIQHGLHLHHLHPRRPVHQCYHDSHKNNGKMEKKQNPCCKKKEFLESNGTYEHRSRKVHR